MPSVTSTSTCWPSSVTVVASGRTSSAGKAAVLAPMVSASGGANSSCDHAIVGAHQEGTAVADPGQGDFAASLQDSHYQGGGSPAAGRLVGGGDGC